MNLYQPQFSQELDLSAKTPERTVLIASTPRCGSHMVGHALTRTGRLGVPYEYLNPANLAEWERRLGTTGAEVTLAEIQKRRTSPNGIFGIKAHFSHCASVGGPDRLFAALPGVRVVHLRRADILRQAISFAIARQTGVWISGQESTSDGAVFDGEMVNDCLNDIALQNARWTQAFAEVGIEPLNIYYEEAERDIAATVTAIARHAGVIGEGDAIDVAAPTTRQSRAGRTDEWIERYAAWSAHRPTAADRVRQKVISAFVGART